MVELARTFRREPLARQPGSSTLVGVPALPRVPDDSGLLAQAGATFAKGLYALSDAAAAINERDRKLKQAEEVAQSAKAVGEFQLFMATVPQQMQEQNVPALQRPDYMKTFGQGQIDTLAQDLPTRVQTAFRAQATQDLARMVFNQQSVASQQFVDEQRTGLPAILAMVATQRVTADERQLPGIDQSLSAIATSYAEAGIISAPLGSALVREAIDKTNTQRAQQAIIANPAAMQHHLTQLAAGRPGTPGLPVPPAKDLPDLKRAADVQMSQDLQRMDREERQSAAKLSQVQDANMQRLQNRLYDSNVTAQEVQRIEAETKQLADQGLIDKTDQAQVLRETRALTQTLSQGPAVTAPAWKVRIMGRLYGSEQGGGGLDALRDDVLQGMVDGQVNIKDGMDWLKEIQNQRQANYYTKIPAYDEGREFLKIATNYLANLNVFMPGADKKAIEQMQSRVAHAFQVYSDRIRGVWERDGVRGVEAQAALIAREVQTLFSVTPQEVLNHFPAPKALADAEGTTIEERYTDAARRLQGMDLPDSERAKQYQLLQERRVIEEQLLRNNPAAAPPKPAPAQPPAPSTPAPPMRGGAPRYPPGDPRNQPQAPKP